MIYSPAIAWVLHQRAIIRLGLCSIILMMFMKRCENHLLQLLAWKVLNFHGEEIMLLSER